MLRRRGSRKRQRDKVPEDGEQQQKSGNLTLHGYGCFRTPSETSIEHGNQRVQVNVAVSEELNVPTLSPHKAQRQGWGTPVLILDL